MIHVAQIKAAAEEAASVALSPNSIDDVLVDPAIGSEGQDILRITLVLDDAVLDAMNGDDFVKTLVSVKKGVRDIGEDRQAVVGYATQAELNDDGDPES